MLIIDIGQNLATAIDTTRMTLVGIAAIWAVAYLWKR